VVKSLVSVFLGLRLVNRSLNGCTILLSGGAIDNVPDAGVPDELLDELVAVLVVYLILESVQNAADIGE
jgi:hypothetical protein